VHCYNETMQSSNRAWRTGLANGQPAFVASGCIGLRKVATGCASVAQCNQTDPNHSRS
jgi:hypothetical protein